MGDRPPEPKKIDSDPRPRRRSAKPQYYISFTTSIFRDVLHEGYVRDPTLKAAHRRSTRDGAPLPAAKGMLLIDGDAARGMCFEHVLLMVPREEVLERSNTSREQC